MPMKLNIGLSKKVGLPDYGRLGATCHVEVELDGSLLSDDVERLQQQVFRWNLDQSWLWWVGGSRSSCIGWHIRCQLYWLCPHQGLLVLNRQQHILASKRVRLLLKLAIIYIVNI